MIQSKKEIRFIITNNCNFNCTFCHNEGVQKKIKMDSVISLNDFKFITKIMQKYFGVNKFVLSGGEPLLSDKIISIAQKIKNKQNKIVLVTNGSLLENKRRIADIVDEIHISLGVLDEKLFRNRTRTDIKLETIKKGVEYIKGRCILKLNAVMLKNENIDEKNLRRLILYAKKNRLEIYLIEAYPVDKENHMSFSEIEKLVNRLGYIRQWERGLRVNYSRNNYPPISIVFIPCSFVKSPLVDDPIKFCKENQSIYILPDLTVQTCFENCNAKEFIYNEVKNRDIGGLVRKFKIIFSNIGKNCPLL